MVEQEDDIQSLDEIQDQLEFDLPVIRNADSLYNAFIGMTLIEKVKEEDFVLKSLLRGVTKNSILRQLKDKHPDTKFNRLDLDKFLSKNPEVFRAMGKTVEKAARRYLQSKEDVNEQMASVIMYTQSLIPELKAEGDNTNTIAAIRALQSAIVSYAQMEGFTTSDNKVQVNIVQQLSEGRTNIRDKVKDVDYTVEDL